MKTRKGFILVLTIGMVSIMSIIVVRMITNLISFQELESVLLQREQAKQLAWSGINIAIAQILQQAPKYDEKLSEAEVTLKKQLFRLRKVMTITNHWQDIVCNEESDGVDGVCKIYIACEQGKINPFVLAQMVKAGEKSGTKDADDKTSGKGAEKRPIHKVIQTALKKYLGQQGRNVDVIQRMLTLLESRKHETWDDVSELLEDEELKKLGDLLFLTPDRDWALTDFFSLNHNSSVLQSWALSRSVSVLADLLPKDEPTDEDIEKIGDTVKQQRPAKETWDIVLNSIYKKQLPAEWYNLLNTRFEANTFSVISYGTYRNIVVKLYAIVQQRNWKEQDGTEHEKCIIKKIYWIYE